MNHKWSRNGLMKQNLLIYQFPATYKFKKKKRKDAGSNAVNKAGIR